MRKSTSWRKLCSQNPSCAYSTPANFRQSFAYFLAIPCEPCSHKSRFFLVQQYFPLYTRGILGCLLGFWPSRPRPCRGNYKSHLDLYFKDTILFFLQNKKTDFFRIMGYSDIPPYRVFNLFPGDWYTIPVVSRPRLEPRSLDPDSSTLPIRPLHLHYFL